MDNEIDVREFIKVLWRGKYFIVAVTVICALVGYFLFTPRYNAEVVINLTPFENTVDDYMKMIDFSGITAEVSAQTGAEELNLKWENLTVIGSSSTQKLIGIKASHELRDTSEEAAETAAILLFEAILQNQKGYLVEEKGHLTRNLEYIDAEFIDQYGTGILNGNAEENPVYKVFMEEKGNLLVEIKEISFRLKELEEGTFFKEDVLIYPAVTDSLSQIRRKKMYNTAIVAFLGFILASGVVFLRHIYIMPSSANHEESEQYEDRKKP